MKKNDVRTGARYLAKVSGAVVPVEIVQERWVGDQHKGWMGRNTESGRSVVIKSAQRLRAAVGEGATRKATKVEPAVAPVAGDAAPGGAGEAPVGVSAKAASPVPPKGGKAAKASKGKKAAGKSAKAAKPARGEPAEAPKKHRPMSGLDAAAKILADSKEPMKVKDIVAAAAKKGLWKSASGKTPEATVYAAIIREIFNKQGESRFVKKDRGLFAAAGR